jgi:hypothetical protein
MIPIIAASDCAIALSIYRALVASVTKNLEMWKDNGDKSIIRHEIRRIRITAADTDTKIAVVIL